VCGVARRQVQLRRAASPVGGGQHPRLLILLACLVLADGVAQRVVGGVGVALSEQDQAEFEAGVGVVVAGVEGGAELGRSLGVQGLGAIGVELGQTPEDTSEVVVDLADAPCRQGRPVGLGGAVERGDGVGLGAGLGRRVLGLRRRPGGRRRYGPRRADGG